MWGAVMIHDDEAKILNLVHYSDYQKGLNYDEDAIYPYDTYVDSLGRHFEFSVQSQSSYLEYEVSILLRGKDISAFCDCKQFSKTHSCKHLAACLICYSNEIFKTESPRTIEQKSKDFLQQLKQDFKSPEAASVRKELTLNFELQINLRSYDYWCPKATIFIKVKIGEKKLYSLNSKLSDFLRAYRNEEDYAFGKEFVYQPAIHYFSKKDEEFLEFLDDISSMGNHYLQLDSRMLKQFFKLNDYAVWVEGVKKQIKIQKGFFFQATLRKEKEKYHLDFDCDFEQVFPLTEDKEFIWYQNQIYQLNAKERYLVSLLQDGELNQIIFSEREFLDFKTCFLPYIKNYIELDETISNLVITKEPTSKLYFDLMGDRIEAKIIFDYDGFEVQYKKAAHEDKILRDEEYESLVYQRLAEYGFQIDKEVIFLEDLEKSVDFVENGLNELSKEFLVFTSEKLKEVQILRKPSVQTTFHLGMDRILNYHFDLDGISQEELPSFFQSLKLKKKYYRLKNGNVMDLTDEKVQEFAQLNEELDLDSSMDGKIPKFKALYLDSLKKTSSIIETDQNFNEFIDTFQKYKNKKITFTKEEKKILRDYQLDGVRWLHTIYSCGFGGILADEMGLGKSLQTIVFLRKILKKDDKILIVCPTSLVYNWENEFQKFAPEMKRMVFSGSKGERRRNLDKFSGNIYITSYGLLKEDFDFYKQLSFQCFIIDEAQAIKNPASDVSKRVKQIHADIKLALTGTPIENSVLELWSIFDFIMPGFLSSLVRFQQKYRIREEFDDETNQLLSRLKLQIKPFLLRRKKSDVAKDLPDKIENTIFIELQEEQKKIYAAAVEEANELMNQMVAQGGFQKNKMIILSLLTKLRQICIHPGILFEDYQGSSVKLTELCRVVKEVISNGHKILLFTSFKTALDLVKKEFDQIGISSYTIAGDVPSKKRLLLVDAFNHDDTNVFLIMLKSGGTGLNLTSADVVIHLDLWWNPQVENQATDRTHRIGQTHQVDVIKLVCKNTIEERILELQAQKKVLSDKLIENGTDEAGFIRSLSEQDIRNLLKYEQEED